MTNSVFRFATVQGAHIHWMLRRNCSVTPSQLIWTYVSLSAVSMGIGLFFWIQGATLVIPFAFLELIALGIALVVYARHSMDGEHISLSGNQLVVELECAGRLERTEFQRNWVRVEPLSDDLSLIELSARGKTIRVGRYIQPALRVDLAREIRSALRTA